MKKRILDFELKGLKLIGVGDFSNIVKGSKGYLRCRFVFSDEWKNITVIATFSNKEKEYATFVKKSMVDLSYDGVCDIPDDILTDTVFTLHLVGVDKRNNYKIKSTDFEIRQV